MSDETEVCLQLITKPTEDGGNERKKFDASDLAQDPVEKPKEGRVTRTYELYRTR